MAAGQTAPENVAEAVRGGGANVRALIAAASVAALVGFGAAWQVQSWRMEAAEAKRAAAEIQARVEAEAEFSRRIQAQQETANEAMQTLRRARLDAAAAGHAADSLREHIAALARQSATPAASSASGASPASLLADMLGRVEASGRELAAEADRARAAGLACERAYDALSSHRAVSRQE